MRYEPELKHLSLFLQNANVCNVGKASGHTCFNGHKCIIFQLIIVKRCICATHLLALH